MREAVDEVSVCSTCGGAGARFYALSVGRLKLSDGEAFIYNNNKRGKGFGNSMIWMFADREVIDGILKGIPLLVIALDLWLPLLRRTS